jgi:uncharacterized protein (DUF305 family)
LTKETTMKIHHALMLAVLAAGMATPAVPVVAADSSLLAICSKDAMDMGAPAAKGGGMAADEAHTALMAGMAAMDAGMDTGMTAKDLDVAFVCGMIPHHQGAIDMARAELKYGDDPWAKQLAQGIIAAQEKEIAEMKDWLGKQPQ